VGYEVSVALIDSTQPKKTPLPVLTRGAGDRGVLSQANLIPPYPALDQIQFPNSQTSVLLGQTLILTGTNLDGVGVSLQFNHLLWSAPIEIAPVVGGTATQVSVVIPNDPVNWPAGFYKVCLLVQRPPDTFRRTTNQLSFGLAPTMTITPANAAGPNITYAATCNPEVRPEQYAALLLGDQEIVAQPHTTQTATLSFQAQNVSAGSYFVRLRIDGVDSQLVNRAVTPPVFDATQKVTVT
jgi:hypothetical protein